MNSAVRLLAFVLQMSVSRAIVCPPPFRDILGVCLNFTTQKTTYCEAQEFCSSIGGELVRGSNFLPLSNRTFIRMPSKFWIGLTDLLHERRSNKSGWRWSDGAEDPPSSELVWNAGEPGNSPGTQDCVFQCFGSGKLCDTDCSPGPGYEGVPMCQPRSLPTSAVRGFEAVPIPVGLPEVEFGEGGCAKLITDIGTDLDCARVCSSESKDWCVSFYFNGERRECRLQLYTDATVKMGDARGWRKFAMRK